MALQHKAAQCLQSFVVVKSCAVPCTLLSAVRYRFLLLVMLNAGGEEKVCLAFYGRFGGVSGISGEANVKNVNQYNSSQNFH